MYSGKNIHQSDNFYHQHHQLPNNLCEPPIWTVTYSSTPSQSIHHRDGSVYFEPVPLHRHHLLSLWLCVIVFLVIMFFVVFFFLTSFFGSHHNMPLNQVNISTTSTVSSVPRSVQHPIIIDGIKDRFVSTLNHQIQYRSKLIEIQFRVSNIKYSRQLKNKTSDAFQKLSRLITEKIDLLVKSSQILSPNKLDKLELILVRKGDNLRYNLNGVIVDIVINFDRELNCSPNDIVQILLNAQKDGLFTGLNIDTRTILVKYKGDNSVIDGNQNNNSDKSDLVELDHRQYVWEKWSEWGQTCENEKGSCSEERVHSRTRYCYDKINQWRVDDLDCIKVFKSQHQSLQIEDCVCDKTYKCLESEWQCLNTQCIPLIKRCDGHMNCFDSSDESNCDCGENEIHCGQNTSCIAIEKKCNNITDCWDNSDESDCPGYVDYD